MDMAVLMSWQYSLISAVCAILLVYIACMFTLLLPKRSADSFLIMSIVCSAATAFADIVNGLREFGAYNVWQTLNNVSMIVYTVSSMLGGMFWYIFAEEKQESWLSKNKKRYIPVVVLFAIVTAGIITSPFTKLYFYFENDVYYRGPLFGAVTITVLLTMTTGFTAIFRSFQKKNYFKRSTLVVIFVYILLAGLIQILQIMAPLVLPFRSVGLMSLYFVILVRYARTNIRRDTLSGINNRFALEHYLHDKLISDEIFGIAIIDVDRFKKINDKYGHRIGDEAITVTAKAICRAVPSGFFVSRFGGDEFVIIGGSIAEEYEREEAVINECIAEIMKEAGHDFTFTVSLGYVIRDKETVHMPDIMALADNELYKRKTVKKEMGLR